MQFSADDFRRRRQKDAIHIEKTKEKKKYMPLKNEYDVQQHRFAESCVNFVIRARHRRRTVITIQSGIPCTLTQLTLRSFSFYKYGTTYIERANSADNQHVSIFSILHVKSLRLAARRVGGCINISNRYKLFCKNLLLYSQHTYRMCYLKDHLKMTR